MTGDSFQSRRIVLGTRGSDLALKQSEKVAVAIRSVAPRVIVERKIITTSGDEDARVQVTDLRAGRKGMFTREIERALLDRNIDIAVHSAKDLPSEMTVGLAIAAALPRANTADLFISRTPSNIADLPADAIVGTSSVRRKHQLRAILPDVQIVDLRGNVPTRLRKFAASDWHGIILARAGIERLGYRLDAGTMEFDGLSLRVAELPLDIFLPAGGQGTIAVQTRADARELHALLSNVDHVETRRCLRAEREFLRLLDADCNAPIGVLVTMQDGLLVLRAQIFENGERQPRAVRIEGNDEPEALARRAWHELYGR